MPRTDKKSKVRRSWTINPVEQVVPNEYGKVKRPPARSVRDEALDEYEDLRNDNDATQIAE